MSHTLTLCREYLDLVDAMRSGQHSTDDLHALDSERQNIHNELCRLTGYGRAVDMYRVARMLLRDGDTDA